VPLALALGVFLLLKCLNLDMLDKLMESPISDDSIDEGKNTKLGTKSCLFFLILVCKSD
jgi:hypothetical protein